MTYLHEQTSISQTFKNETTIVSSQNGGHRKSNSSLYDKHGGSKEAELDEVDDQMSETMIAGLTSMRRHQ